ncbi:MAG TPA: long-chain fatty acid--CoA ligase [Planctomycetes bacterium]|nr:long-chain fatty acid--CoA ligase [Planctomycetota bacterium]
MVRILEETPGDPTAIDRAWEEPETFCVLPAKGDVSAQWVRAQWELLPERFERDHFALLTSGSTGAPKLVVGERCRAEALARLLHEVQDSECVAEAILTLPLSYCYSFVNQWLWARVVGRRLVPTLGFTDPARLAHTLEAARDGMLCLVGAQLALFEEHLPGRTFPGIVRLHFAGGPFPQARLERLAERFPNASVFNNYGCAEAMPRLTLRRAEEADEPLDVGRPLPGVELRRGEGGALEFRSPFGAVALVEEGRGRVLDPEEWIPTGDHGDAVQGGSWRLAGRKGDVFKRFGEKISLARIRESVAGAFDGEVQTYREVDRMGEEGFSLLLSPTPSDEDVRAVLLALRRKHPRTHWPLRVESVERLPRLPNGKVALGELETLEGKTLHWKNRI